mmetsp:Transcript_40657/g.45419  ORF Transcript_40657/g.45419 Transcript_40657/m.45419 type:complete len:162 (+) Transcript_40657:926-1411(+)
MAYIVNQSGKLEENLYKPEIVRRLHHLYLYQKLDSIFFSLLTIQANCVKGSLVIPYVWSCKVEEMLVSATEFSRSGATIRESSFATDIVTWDACSKLWKGFLLYLLEIMRMYFLNCIVTSSSRCIDWGSSSLESNDGNSLIPSTSSDTIPSPVVLIPVLVS